MKTVLNIKIDQSLKDRIQKAALTEKHKGKMTRFILDAVEEKLKKLPS